MTRRDIPQTLTGDAARVIRTPVAKPRRKKPKPKRRPKLKSSQTQSLRAGIANSSIAGNQKREGGGKSQTQNPRAGTADSSIAGNQRRKKKCVTCVASSLRQSANHLAIGLVQLYQAESLTQDPALLGQIMSLRDKLQEFIDLHFPIQPLIQAAEAANAKKTGTQAH